MAFQDLSVLAHPRRTPTSLGCVTYMVVKKNKCSSHCLGKKGSQTANKWLSCSFFLIAMGAISLAFGPFPISHLELAFSGTSIWAGRGRELWCGWRICQVGCCAGAQRRAGLRGPECVLNVSFNLLRIIASNSIMVPDFVLKLCCKTSAYTRLLGIRSGLQSPSRRPWRMDAAQVPVSPRNFFRLLQRKEATSSDLGTIYLHSYFHMGLTFVRWSTQKKWQKVADVCLWLLIASQIRWVQKYYIRANMKKLADWWVKTAGFPAVDYSGWCEAAKSSNSPL